MNINCNEGAIEFFRFLGDCIYGDVSDIVGFILGIISLLFWIAVGVPQFYANFKTQEAESLGIFFLSIWLVGDLLSVAGCILANVLPTQLYLAVWYLFMDFFIIIQMYYYRFKRICNNSKISEQQEPLVSKSEQYLSFRDMEGESKVKSPPRSNNLRGLEKLSRDSFLISPRSFISNDQTNESPPTSPVSVRRDKSPSSSSINDLGTSPTWKNSSSVYFVSLSLLIAVPSFLQLYSNQDQAPSYLAMRKLHTIGNTPTKEYLGAIFGWISATLYICSRIPHIVRNFRNKTTEAISIPIFILCVFGTLTYILSLLIRSTDLSFLHDKMPWLVSSFGTLLLDSVICVQYFKYRNNRWASATDDFD